MLCRGRSGAQESEQRGGRGLPRHESANRQRPGSRPGRCRCRALRAGCRGLRRIRGTRRPGVGDRIAPADRPARAPRSRITSGSPRESQDSRLRRRALVQAQKFGAEIQNGIFGPQAQLRRAAPTPSSSGDGHSVHARVRSSSPPAPNTVSSRSRNASRGSSERAFITRATATEAKTLRGQGGDRGRRREFGRPGGGLFGRAAAATCICWSARRGLADSMSNYLIRRIAETANVTLHTRAPRSFQWMEGDRLEQVDLAHRTGRTGAKRAHLIGHVFLMTGAVPSTHWLEGCIALNDKGFVRTGLDLTADLTAYPTDSRDIRRSRSKRTGPGSLPSATFDAGASSGWRQPSGRDPPAFSKYISRFCLPPRRQYESRDLSRGRRISSDRERCAA